jgi:hypothetical protein
MDFVYDNKTEQFETEFMKALYDYVYRLGRAGYSWHKTPPGLSAASAETLESAGVQ